MARRVARLLLAGLLLAGCGPRVPPEEFEGFQTNPDFEGSGRLGTPTETAPPAETATPAETGTPFPSGTGQ